MDSRSKTSGSIRSVALLGGAALARLAALALLASGVGVGTGCGGEPASVSLRAFPPPFRAGLAVCSDIDDTDSVEEFLAVQDFLCGDGATALGPGLGLEIGNSFWFHDLRGRSSFTWFRDADGTPSDCAPLMEEMIAAGFLDVLHSYGEIPGPGFTRELAEGAIAELESLRERRGVTVGVWVNHGGRTNLHRLGPLARQMGDDPGAPAYHADLLKAYGTRFLHVWDITHVVGQEAPRRPVDRLKDLWAAASWSARRLVGKTGMRPHDSSDLLFPMTLDDGNRFLAFSRFMNARGKGTDDCAGLAGKIAPAILDELVAKEGALVVYTPLGDNEGIEHFIPPGTAEALRALAARAKAGEILVTTTSRLLTYEATRKYLRWAVEERNGEVVIDIVSVDDPVDGPHLPTPEELMGITFEVPDAERTRIRVAGVEAGSVVRAPARAGGVARVSAGPGALSARRPRGRTGSGDVQRKPEGGAFPGKGTRGAVRDVAASRSPPEPFGTHRAMTGVYLLPEEVPMILRTHRAPCSRAILTAALLAVAIVAVPNVDASPPPAEMRVGGITPVCQLGIMYVFWGPLLTGQNMTTLGMELILSGCAF